MNALQAKILILSYLYELNKKWPSKQDYTSLPVLLKSNKVQIPESEFARSVVNSLAEDGHVVIASETSGSTEIGIRITDRGIVFLNEITKPILAKLTTSIIQLWVKHWKTLLPIIVSIILVLITIAVNLFIHFDSTTTSKPQQEKSDTKQQKSEPMKIKHIKSQK